ncbi:MAG: peroxiredoxin [Actinomycetes bacterium]
MTLEIGTPAPDFSLLGTDGTELGKHTYRRSDYLGQPLVLVFYPADHSPVCTVQLQTYSHDIAQFADVGAQVLALSPQSVDEHSRFSASHNLAFPLLSDTDKVVGAAFGILGPLGFYRRSLFVIDDLGVIRYAHRATAGFTFRPTDEIVDAVLAIGDLR